MYAMLAKQETLSPMAVMSRSTINILKTNRVSSVFFRLVTVAGDKHCDTHDFVRRFRRLGITPYVPQNHTQIGRAILWLDEVRGFS